MVIWLVGLLTVIAGMVLFIFLADWATLSPAEAETFRLAPDTVVGYSATVHGHVEKVTTVDFAAYGGGSNTAYVFTEEPNTAVIGPPGLADEGDDVVFVTEVREIRHGELRSNYFFATGTVNPTLYLVPGVVVLGLGSGVIAHSIQLWRKGRRLRQGLTERTAGDAHSEVPYPEPDDETRTRSGLKGGP